MPLQAFLWCYRIRFYATFVCSWFSNCLTAINKVYGYRTSEIRLFPCSKKQKVIYLESEVSLVPVHCRSHWCQNMYNFKHWYLFKFMSHYERNFKIFSVIHVHSKSKYDLNFVPSRKSSLLTLIYLKSLVRWGFPLTDSRHKGLTPQISPGGSHLSPEHFRLSLLPVLNRLWEQTTWLIFGAEIPSQYT